MNKKNQHQGAISSLKVQVFILMGHHFKVGRIVKNKQGKKAYLINEDYYSVTTSKHQCYVRNAIPTWAMVFSVGDNISDTGNMRFVASKLESIKKSIEKYKRAKTELSYTDIWGRFWEYDGLHSVL